MGASRLSARFGSQAGDLIARHAKQRIFLLSTTDKGGTYIGTDQPFIYRDKVFGLDTDYVTGKSLTGILLPSFQFVSVPSRGNLWMQVRRSYQAPKARPSMPRTSIAPAWSEEQNQELTLLFQKVQEVNSRFMSQVQDIPGYIDLTPRQQSRLYSELVGQGMLANLLHLTRVGKLDMNLMRKIVQDPKQLSLLMDSIKVKG